MRPGYNPTEVGELLLDIVRIGEHSAEMLEINPNNRLANEIDSLIVVVEDRIKKMLRLSDEEVDNLVSIAHTREVSP